MELTIPQKTLFTPITADAIADLYQRFTKTAIAVLLLYRARDPFGNTTQDLDAEDVASTLGCSPSSVRRAIASLVEAGMISVSRACRRLNPHANGTPFPRKLVAQKCAHPHRIDHASAKLPPAAQSCAIEAPEPLPVADPSPAQIINDPDDQTKESGPDIFLDLENASKSDPGYIRWLLERGRSLPRPPQLLFEWVNKQMGNPLNLAEYKGDPGAAIALLGDTSPALPPNTISLPPNTQELPPNMQKPILKPLTGAEAPISPEAHLKRMVAKWNTQKSAAQRAAIAKQIEENPGWGLVCDPATGPALTEPEPDF
jgi:hypothetical protein